MKKSTTDSIVAGVCGGLAEHFGIDAFWVRVLAVVLTLSTGIGLGLVVYAIAAFIMK